MKCLHLEIFEQVFSEDIQQKEGSSEGSGEINDISSPAKHDPVNTFIAEENVIGLSNETPIIIGNGNGCKLTFYN